MASHIFGEAGAPLSYFAVIQSTDTTAHVIGIGSSSPGYRKSHGAGLLIDESAAVVKAIKGSSGLFLPALTTSYTTGALVTAIARGRASSIGTGGVIESNDVVNVLNPDPYTRSCLGAADGSAGGAAIDPFDGSLSEILIYRYLTATEIAQIETYLLTKYFPTPLTGMVITVR